MGTLVNALADVLEGLLVFLATFAVAAIIMGSFGGIEAVEVRLALLEAIVAFVAWLRYSPSRA